MTDLSHRTPFGAQTRSKQWQVFGGSPYPQTLSSAAGSHTWSDYDHEYIDWMAALASVGLGHRNAHVDSAVWEQMRAGTALSLPSYLEYELADLLCTVLKWPEQVRFVKTGSEATAAAMMIARRATGRKKVISIGYHGWHEAHLPSDNLVDVPWGTDFVDGGELDARTAAVLIEPMRDHHETPYGKQVETYIKNIQARCKMAGSLLIMDEMVTGFRWAIGGASEYFRITPDLACYGKAMANGYPLSAIVGPKRLMRFAHEVSSTFGGECMGLAAGKATIEVYQREPVIARMWQVGERLKAAIPQLSGWPVHPWLNLDENQRIAVVQHCAREGVLMHPAGMNPMYAHSDEDVTRTIEVLSKALESVSKGTVGA